MNRHGALRMIGIGTAAAAAASVAAATTAAAQRGNASVPKPLVGKVAIVTGARANMGRAFSEALAKMGADIVVHYHRASTLGEAEQTAALVRAAGQRAALVQGDLGDVNVVKTMFDTAEQRFGGVDIVINNAGAILKKPMAEFTDEEFDRLDRVNNRGLFYSLREAARRVRDGGRIINNGTSLLAGAAPGYSIYAGTKAPVEEYTRMLAKDSATSASQ